MTIRYTRYLYAIDEVLYTLQECLIKKRDLNECIFWVGEIYHSKHNEELWSFIYEFYYNISIFLDGYFINRFSIITDIYMDISRIICLLSIFESTLILSCSS